MSRDLSPELLSEIKADSLSPFFAVEVDFGGEGLDNSSADRISRAWTGLGDIEINENTFLGAGQFLSIGAINESSEVKATGIKIQLNGLTNGLIATALSENYQGNQCRVYFGATGYIKPPVNASIRLRYRGVDSPPATSFLFEFHDQNSNSDSEEGFRSQFLQHSTIEEQKEEIINSINNNTTTIPNITAELDGDIIIFTTSTEGSIGNSDSLIIKFNNIFNLDIPFPFTHEDGTELTTTTTTTATTTTTTIPFTGGKDEIDNLITPPYIIFEGEVDKMNITHDTDTTKITLSVESKLIDLERPRIKRYTDEEQKNKYPNDRGMEFVHSLQNKKIDWGVE